ncbi:unnamed protein product [Cyprideis torosa]|uniref:Uncharacterized protein n=1 Tax=Cyprideis torosa TaxID=163714 RepID=A0A7R8W7Q6_9CRUS|nr:unnamed protein product [Cyprideis torosa]CAG0882430.1 unnamed protein product [Cyprideis torosa]
MEADSLEAFVCSENYFRQELCAGHRSSWEVHPGIQTSWGKARSQCLLPKGKASEPPPIGSNWSSLVDQESYGCGVWQRERREIVWQREKRMEIVFSCLLRGTQLQQQLSSQMAALDRAKKAYDRAFRESERAAENFYKADRDLNLSRAEVEKHRMTSIAKSQACTDAKSEYALQLNKTNELQRDHYYTKMPDVFRDLQGLDEKRINAIRTFLHRSVSIERERQPIKESCLDGILKAADSINQIADSAAVIERFKSGFSPPTDIPFEDLSVPPPSPEAGPNGSAVLSPSNGAHTNGKIGGLSLKGTISGKGFKKTRAGLKGLFGGNANNKLFSSTSALESTNGMCSFLKDDVTDLPPNQRKRHLQQRLDTITTNIQQKQSLRDGLIKMRTVYIENPHYGDAASTEDQLKEIEAALSALDQERVRISRELEMLLNGASDRTSLSDQESLSRSASDSSVSNPSSGHPAPHPAPSGGRGSRINSMGLRAHAANATNPPSSHTFRNYQQYWSQLHLNVDLENARRGWLNTSDGDSSNVVRVETSREYSTRDVHVPHHHHMLPIQMHSPDADGEGVHRVVGAEGYRRSPRVQLRKQEGVRVVPFRGLTRRGYMSLVVMRLDEQLRSSNSPESGLGTSHISLHDSDPEDEFQPLPVIGRCRALYPFEAQSDGAIPMCEGEELFVLETDQGDGWTRVRRIEDSEEGFVPTSYIESTLHTSVA